jgi:hypothetical protein
MARPKFAAPFRLHHLAGDFMARSAETRGSVQYVVYSTRKSGVFGSDTPDLQNIV